MKRIAWRKHHKWSGLVAAILLLAFCLSGLALNHRQVLAEADVSRRWLPARYAFRDWNNGLLRGTFRLPVTAGDHRRVVIYGAAGLLTADSVGRHVADFNAGLPAAADRRRVLAAACLPDGTLFAACTFGLYRRHLPGAWTPVALPLPAGERLSDLCVRGDTLVVASRSFFYVSTDAAHRRFSRVQLAPSPDADGRVTLFRTVWALHSGELFGLPGRLVVDAVAVALIALSVTGLLQWFLPALRRWRRKRQARPAGGGFLRRNLGWHDRLGRTAIGLALLVAVTGWCLRPPLMIPLALTRVGAIPGTALDSHNPWHDRLRLVRYDTATAEWLISTSEGFFALPRLDAAPRRVAVTPPVSVMGLNVWQRDSSGRWLCGSFRGLYVWDRRHGRVTDWFTGAPAPAQTGPPIGERAISGYSADFALPPVVVDYDAGTPALPQPAALRHRPMPLWNVALELHSGRLFFGAAATYFFIFIAGALVLWCLWSGWKVRRRMARRRHAEPHA